MRGPDGGAGAGAQAVPGGKGLAGGKRGGRRGWVGRRCGRRLCCRGSVSTYTILRLQPPVLAELGSAVPDAVPDARAGVDLHSLLTSVMSPHARVQVGRDSRPVMRAAYECFKTGQPPEKVRGWRAGLVGLNRHCGTHPKGHACVASLFPHGCAAHAALHCVLNTRLHACALLHAASVQIMAQVTDNGGHDTFYGLLVSGSVRRLRRLGLLWGRRCVWWWWVSGGVPPGPFCARAVVRC